MSKFFGKKTDDSSAYSREEPKKKSFWSLFFEPVPEDEDAFDEFEDEDLPYDGPAAPTRQKYSIFDDIEDDFEDDDDTVDDESAAVSRSPSKSRVKHKAKQKKRDATRFAEDDESSDEADLSDKPALPAASSRRSGQELRSRFAEDDELPDEADLSDKPALPVGRDAASAASPATLRRERKFISHDNPYELSAQSVQPKDSISATNFYRQMQSHLSDGAARQAPTPENADVARIPSTGAATPTGTVPPSVAPSLATTLPGGDSLETADSQPSPASLPNRKVPDFLLGGFKRPDYAESQPATEEISQNDTPDGALEESVSSTAVSTAEEPDAFPDDSGIDDALDLLVPDDSSDFFDDAAFDLSDAFADDPDASQTVEAPDGTSELPTDASQDDADTFENEAAADAQIPAEPVDASEIVSAQDEPCQPQEDSSAPESQEVPVSFTYTDADFPQDTAPAAAERVDFSAPLRSRFVSGGLGIAHHTEHYDELLERTARIIHDNPYAISAPPQSSVRTVAPVAAAPENIAPVNVPEEPLEEIDETISDRLPDADGPETDDSPFALRVTQGVRGSESTRPRSDFGAGSKESVPSDDSDLPGGDSIRLFDNDDTQGGDAPRGETTRTRIFRTGTSSTTRIHINETEETLRMEEAQRKARERTARLRHEAYVERQNKRKKRQAALRKLFGNVAFVVFFIVAVLVAVYYGFLLSDIVVMGNEEYSSDYIIKQSGLKLGTHMLLCNLDDAKTNISEDPYLQVDSINYIFPSRIRIIITERKEVAGIVGLDYNVIIDKNGYVLSMGSGVDISGLLQVTGVSMTGFQLGQRLGEGNDFTTATLISIIEKLEEYSLMDSISNIDLTTPLAITMTAQNGLKIHLGQSTDLDAKMQSLQKILPQFIKQAISTGTLYLSAKGGTVYSPAGAQGAVPVAQATEETQTPEEGTGLSPYVDDNGDGVDDLTGEPIVTPEPGATPTPPPTPTPRVPGGASDDFSG